MKKFTVSEKKFVPLFFFYDRFIDLEKYRFSRIRWSRRKCLLAFLLFFLLPFTPLFLCICLCRSFRLSSMLTCLIAILTLFVSLETLVKREPLNTASLDAGYKSISENRKYSNQSRVHRLYEFIGNFASNGATIKSTRALDHALFATRSEVAARG